MVDVEDDERERRPGPLRAGELAVQALLEGAAVVADKLRGALSRRVAGPVLTVSFGVAEVRGGRADARDVFDEADRALYAAKRAGRDRVVRSDEIRPRLRPAF